MTIRELYDVLLPVLGARWPTMIGRKPSNGNELTIAIANEKNEGLYQEFQEFDVDTVVDVARAFSKECPSLPDGKGHAWVVSQLKSRLRRTVMDRTNAWKWEDELDLWNHMTKYARFRETGELFGARAGHFPGTVIGPDYEDEGWIARTFLDKSPTAQERVFAYASLCRHIDGVRERMMERKALLSGDVDVEMPYPREGYWQLRERWRKAVEIQRTATQPLFLEATPEAPADPIVTVEEEDSPESFFANMEAPV